MKQAHMLAMRARQRSERYAAVTTGDIEGMTTEDLRGYLVWMERAQLLVTGARYAQLDLLEDMAREELTKR